MISFSEVMVVAVLVGRQVECGSCDSHSLQHQITSTAKWRVEECSCLGQRVVKSKVDRMTVCFRLW
jgi:hypothetical protein